MFLSSPTSRARWEMVICCSVAERGNFSPPAQKEFCYLTGAVICIGGSTHLDPPPRQGGMWFCFLLNGRRISSESGSRFWAYINRPQERKCVESFFKDGRDAYWEKGLRFCLLIRPPPKKGGWGWCSPHRRGCIKACALYKPPRSGQLPHEALSRRVCPLVKPPGNV